MASIAARLPALPRRRASRPIASAASLPSRPRAVLAHAERTKEDMFRQE